MPFIFDVDSAFQSISITGSDFQKMVIKEIDGGSYCNNRTFVDRFGDQLKYENLSTGSKALILLDIKKDTIINFTECGDNALMLLQYIDSGKLFFEDRDTEIPFDKEYNVLYNGNDQKGVSQLNYWFC